MKYKILTLLITIFLLGCGSTPTDVKKVASLPPIFPDYIDVTIPAGIAPLNFAVVSDKEEVQRIDVTIKGANGDELHANGKYADFNIDKWHKLTEENRGRQLTVSVCAKIAGEWKQYDDFTINVSPYPLDEWGLTYRRIAPGYEVYSKMGIYQRDLGNFNEFSIIENTMTDGQCYNCHTANRTNPNDFVFHVRGQHGATLVSKNGECTWLKAANDTLGGSMVYPYWHPSGRYCAFSTNQTRQGFHISGPKRLEVFDLSSDVLVYDTEKNEILLDSLLNKKAWSENTPSFSPDGKWLYFTTCYQQEYPLKHKEERYNLCRIAFDETTGHFGSQVDTLFNAVDLDKSVTWPRPSYDGKYILFTLSDYGYFSIWHKESDQWLLNTATGEARPAEEINSNDADSFHNWSDNSRWVVFTSRRNDGLYSNLYLTCIDDNGHFSKPFLLPQANPEEYYTQSLYSFNTPDFTKTKVDFNSRAAVEAILSDERIPAQVR
ncbi:MAG: hypothetical protein K2H60_06090 [Muribaculaceae bacterium]|nr:hypothetical protein [Muribaculaceae bacterium]